MIPMTHLQCHLRLHLCLCRLDDIHSWVRHIKDDADDPTGPERQKDLDEILSWMRNINNDAVDPTADFKKIGQMLRRIPPKFREIWHGWVGSDFPSDLSSLDDGKSERPVAGAKEEETRTGR